MEKKVLIVGEADSGRFRSSCFARRFAPILTDFFNAKNAKFFWGRSDFQSLPREHTDFQFGIASVARLPRAMVLLRFQRVFLPFFFEKVCLTRCDRIVSPPQKNSASPCLRERNCCFPKIKRLNAVRIIDQRQVRGNANDALGQRTNNGRPVRTKEKKDRRDACPP